MSSERVLPKPSDNLNISFKIFINGEDVSANLQILSLLVKNEVNRIATAKLIVRDGDASKETFEISNSEYFVPGNEITIEAGYVNQQFNLFKGVVIKQAIKITENVSYLTIDCKHAAFKTTLNHRNRYFENITDSEMVQQILNEYSLEADIDPTEITHDNIAQFQATDWDFMLTRMDVNGLLCATDIDKLRFFTPRFEEVRKKEEAEDNQEAKEPFTLIFGANILEFDAEMDARVQHPGVTAKGWDASSQEYIEVEVSESGVKEPGNLSAAALAENMGAEPQLLHHGGIGNLQELESWARARLQKNHLAKIRGRVRFTGCADIKVGEIIRVKGVGDRMSGDVFVSGIRHEFSNGSWTTDLQFGIDEEWFAAQFPVATPATGYTAPAVDGLQIGKVVDLIGDPQGNQRILVSLPVGNQEENTLWARLVQDYAGADHGSMFYPEIDDEVVVGFLANDPRHPVVIGSLYSSAQPPAMEMKQENEVKTFLSRSGLKFSFNEKEKSIALETPDGSKVHLSDDAGTITIENKDHKVNISSDGIELQSAKDITLKANGDIKLDAQNITSSAMQSYKSEGKSMMELISSANTVIKGAMVQIN